MNRIKSGLIGALLLLTYFVTSVITSIVIGVIMFSLTLWVLRMPNPGVMELARVAAAVTFMAKYISAFFKEGE